MGLLDDVFGNELDNMLNQYPAYIEDLNEGTVQAIFNRCLATKDTPVENIRNSILYHKNAGADKDYTPLSFDNIALQKNIKEIQYLCGQLQIIHTKYPMITFENGILKYDQKTWTTDKSILKEFFHLVRAAGILTPFSPINAADLVGIVPTLSPKDPNFPAWWEAHKGEWKD